MMRMILILLTSLISVLLMSQAFAADQPFYANLSCSGKQEVLTHPCHGTNSRAMEIILVHNTPMGASGYRESRVYGGCYGTQDEGYGRIDNIHSDGKTVTFTLTRQGDFEGTVPQPYDSGAKTEVINASLNLATMTLTLDTSDVFWTYRSPSILSCRSKS